MRGVVGQLKSCYQYYVLSSHYKPCFSCELGLSYLDFEDTTIFCVTWVICLFIHKANPVLNIWSTWRELIPEDSLGITTNVITHPSKPEARVNAVDVRY